jgi:hypothetical protein
MRERVWSERVDKIPVRRGPKGPRGIAGVSPADAEGAKGRGSRALQDRGAEEPRGDRNGQRSDNTPLNNRPSHVHVVDSGSREGDAGPISPRTRADLLPMEPSHEKNKTVGAAEDQNERGSGGGRTHLGAEMAEAQLRDRPLVDTALNEATRDDSITSGRLKAIEEIEPKLPALARRELAPAEKGVASAPDDVLRTVRRRQRGGNKGRWGGGGSGEEGRRRKRGRGRDSPSREEAEEGPEAIITGDRQKGESGAWRAGDRNEPPRAATPQRSGEGQ